METTGIKVYAPAQGTKTVTVKTSVFDKQIEAFERNRFGLMAVFITVQSCLGGIACLYILQHNNNTLPLCIAAMAGMGANAMMIAQASAKVCLLSFYGSVLIHAALILFYL